MFEDFRFKFEARSFLNVADEVTRRDFRQPPHVVCYRRRRGHEADPKQNPKISVSGFEERLGLQT